MCCKKSKDGRRLTGKTTNDLVALADWVLITERNMEKSDRSTLLLCS
jgi:hypothetical protein